MKQAINAELDRILAEVKTAQDELRQQLTLLESSITTTFDHLHSAISGESPPKRSKH